MLLDLTYYVSANSEVMKWAKSQDNKHIAMGHVGTHLDTYEKISIPLEYFKSRGIIFDVRNIKEVGINDIDLSLIKENDFVLFYTAQIEKYTYGSKEYFNDYSTELSNELINTLISKKIRFIGIDNAGIRNHNEHEKADRLCEKNGIYVIENLCNLNKLNNNKDFILYTNWFDDDEMTGLRCKVIAECSD